MEEERRTVDGGLTAQLLKHLGRSRESIARLADRDVEDELLDAKLLHRILLGVGLVKDKSVSEVCSSFMLIAHTILSDIRSDATPCWLCWR